MGTSDRIAELVNQNRVTGIDFINVDKELKDGQAVIDIHFLVHPGQLEHPLQEKIVSENIIIYRDKESEKQKFNPDDLKIRWLPDGQPYESQDTLQVLTPPPSDRSLYVLKISNELIDPFYNNIIFSYQAGCISDLDCKSEPQECSPGEKKDFPVDYSSRDFWSFRGALLDFASLRFPSWKERLEADAGMMLIEVLSALGDEFAYYQDRIAREAFLETATQRRSVRRHARLVDYPMHDGSGGFTWIDVEVKKDNEYNISAGTKIGTFFETTGAIQFEVGTGLTDILSGNSYHISTSQNSFRPYIWDVSDKCLLKGSTKLFLKGQQKNNLPLLEATEEDKKLLNKRSPEKGKWVLLQSANRTDLSSRKCLIWIITVAETDSSGNPLLDPVRNEPVTLIEWDASLALPYDMNLENLEVRGNIIPVTAGELITKYFTCGDPELLGESGKKLERTVEREGPNGTVTHLFSLEKTDSSALVFLGSDPRNARPEMHLSEVVASGSEWQEKGTSWEWRKSFLGSHSSGTYERHFVLDDGMWRRVVAYHHEGKEFVHKDYCSGEGKTIRFGDGEFGMLPSGQTVFKVIYRVVNSGNFNIPADTLVLLSSDDLPGGTPLGDIIKKITNPFPLNNGKSSESIESVKLNAPEAFKSEKYRAVLESDYSEAVERLEWVQRAEAKFRWTGSWISTCVTADPYGMTTLTEDQVSDMNRQLDLFRQAGRETIVRYPEYADLDLEITICVSPDHFTGEVKQRILDLLILTKTTKNGRGFFSSDNFTFGVALERSVLEAVIFSVTGVIAVKCMNIRRRGWHDWRAFNELSYKVAAHEVIRIENNPLHPEYGSLKILTDGGA
jgi:hypothetical protein